MFSNKKMTIDNYNPRKQEKSHFSVGEHKYLYKNNNIFFEELMMGSKGDFWNRHLGKVTVGVIGFAFTGYVCLLVYHPGETLGATLGIGAGILCADKISSQTRLSRDNTMVAGTIAGIIIGGFAGHEVSSLVTGSKSGQKNSSFYQLKHNPMDKYHETAEEMSASGKNAIAWPGFENKPVFA